jgi:hypothetical protein
MIPKAEPTDFLGRFREVVSDPINILIERDPRAGLVENGLVYLHNGNRVPASGPLAYYGDFSNILIINRGVHEPLEEYIFQEVLKALPDRPSMLELGAYWAHYSMWLKKKFPAATAIMVEPDPNNMAAGRSNFRLNQHHGEFIEAFIRKGALSVDQLFHERKLKCLDILHSDIQGQEIEMLEESSIALTAHAIDYILISTHSQDGHERVRSILLSHNYRIEVAADFDNETTSFDGLIFASSPAKSALLPNFRAIGRQEICAASAADLAGFVASRVNPP